MSKLACLKAGQLLQGRAAGLSAAGSLMLEEHVSGCSMCRADARMLDALQHLDDMGAAPLSRSARQRAISGALAQSLQTSAQTRAPRYSWLGPSALGALAAIALVATGVALRPNAGLSASINKPTQPSAPALTQVDRVISGQLEVDGALLGVGQGLQGASQFSTKAGAVVALAHATLELRPGTRAGWDAGTHALSLQEGALVADVDPSRHQAFSVETSLFRVLVLGTRFEVSSDRVRVLRGRVQVLAPDGRELARLGAGQSYSTDVAASAPPSAAAEQGVAAATAVAPSPRRDPNALLDEARVELAGGRVKRARGLVEQALSVAVQTGQRAEALSLRAECALIEGKPAAAVSGYELVAARFARLPAGENASFAAARIEADRGSRASAIRLFERYLARYPHGRFVKEASARLHELRAPGTQP